MSEVTIYGITNSRTARVLWLAAELGIDAEHIDVHWKDEAGAEQHRKRNPNGRVPVLDDGSLRLFESMAINLHLARTRGGELAPRDAGEDALVLQWSFWVVSECETWMERIMGTSGPGHEAERERAITRLERPLDALDIALQGRDYLVGDRFTVADLNVASVFSWGRNGHFPFDRWPTVDAWLRRCLDRPKLIVDGDPSLWS